MRRALCCLCLFIIAARLVAAEPAETAPGDAGSTTAPAKPKPPPKDLIVAAYLGYRQGANYSGSEYMLDSWVPLHLLVKNNMKEIFEGTLRCVVTDRRRQNTYRNTYETRVILAGHGSMKHIVLHVYLPESLKLVPGRLGAELIGHTHPLLSRPLPIDETSAHERIGGEEENRIFNELVLILSDRLRFLPKWRPVANCRAQRFAVRVDLESLPRRWLGYSGVTTVIWDGQDLGKLEHLARQALLDYVRAGGQLLIAVGENRNAIMADGFLLGLLPCTLGPQESRDLATNLLGTAGRSPALVTRLVPKPDARVVQRDPVDKEPLAVSHYYGAGAITALAFSLTSDFCQSRAALTPAAEASENDSASRWSQWLDPVLNRYADPLQNQLPQHIRKDAHVYLKKNATRSIPARSSIVAFLAIYLLVLVPLTYTVFRGWQKVELAWVAIPVIAVAFAYGAWSVAFANIEKSLSITDISVIRMAQDGDGSAFTMSLLHNPSYQRYDLNFTDPRFTPLYLRANMFPGYQEDNIYHHAYQEDAERGISLLDQHIAFDTTRLFESSGVVRVGDGLAIRLKPDALAEALPPDRVLGEVDNRTGLYLHDMALVWGGGGILLDPLPPEDGVSLRALAGETRLSIPELCDALSSRAVRSELSPITMSALSMTAMGEKRAVLFGILKMRAATWQVDKKTAPSNAFSFLVIPCPDADPRRIQFQAPQYREDIYEPPPVDDTWY